MTDSIVLFTTGLVELHLILVPVFFMLYLLKKFLPK